MSKQYLGLVIGGPADGQRIVNDNPKLVVEEKPPSPPILLEPRQTINLVEHTRGTPTTGQTPGRLVFGCCPIGLWLLPGWTLDKAVEHMARNVGIPALTHAYEQLRLEQRSENARG